MMERGMVKRAGKGAGPEGIESELRESSAEMDSRTRESKLLWR